MAALLDRALTVALTLATVTIAGSLVYRVVKSPAPVAAVSAERAATFHQQWEQFTRWGITTHGDTTAALTVVEFADLECPACREFHAMLREFVQEHRDRVRVVYLAFPLPSHRLAMPAARAVDCLGSAAESAALIDAFYQGQDSIGIKSWSKFAVDAGISDTARVTQCAVTKVPVPRVDSSFALARRLKLPGTPTVLINGWQMPGTPTRSQLDSALSKFARIKG